MNFGTPCNVSGSKVMTWGQTLKLNFRGHQIHISTRLDEENAMTFLVFRYRYQGWVGSRFRLRPRLPEAGLFAKMLASRPASASKHSKVAGFGHGFGFLKCRFDGVCFGFGFVIIFTTGFGFGFAFPEFVSGFRGSIGVLIQLSFTNLVRLLFTCRRTFSPPSARRATYAFLRQ